MAYVEVWKNERLITRHLVDEQKARSGCRIRLGSLGQVRLAIGQSEKLGDFVVRMFEGQPPPIPQKLKETASILPHDTQTSPPPSKEAHAPVFHDASRDGGPAPHTGQMDSYPNIEGYKIIERLGEGGMGMVWRAEQISTKRQVALKLMTAHGAISPKAQARFQREVEVTARLDHPNIARIYESGLHRGMYYYAMELIDGVPLDQYVKSKALTQIQILKLMYTVCQAVLYAHLRAVIHRDLKPSNILVTPDGQPHVLDFGLAKALLEEDEIVTLSIEGQIAGTPAYMSPEQAAGHHGEIDTRTDVYSLGVILYELLVGQSPHDLTGSMFDVIGRITEGKIRRPRELNKAIDSDLEAILLKALAHNPEQRYASAGTLAMDINNYLMEEPLDARAPTAFYFIRKKAWKYRTQVGIAFAVLAILIFAYTRAIQRRVELKSAEKEIQSQTGKAELAEQKAKWTELELKILGKNEQEARDALRIIRDEHFAGQQKIDELQKKVNRLDRELRKKVSAWIGSFTFGKPTNLGAPVNTNGRETSPCISPNGLELYFSSDRPNGYGGPDVWVARRATISDQWSEPVNLGSNFNSDGEDTPTDMSSDGLELYLTKRFRRPPPDIWVAKRSTIHDPWGQAENLNQPAPEKGESKENISPDGLTRYFSSISPTYSEDIYVTIRATKQDPWGTPINLGQPVNTSGPEISPCISPNGLELYFASERPGGYGKIDIWVARRATTSDLWSEPVNLGPKINTPEVDIPSSISNDGLELYLIKPPRLPPQMDIWIVKRATINDPWGPIVNLGPPVNTSENEEYDACISSDGLMLYFVVRRPQRFERVNIYLTTRATKYDSWGQPVDIGSPINSPVIEESPYISADGLVLLFVSFRHDGRGATDIYITRRPSIDKPWLEPLNIGTPINSSSLDGSPEISADGSTFFFDSMRSGGLGSHDLWQAPIISIVDFNSDKKVDINDLVTLIQNWDQNEPSVDISPLPFGDGKIDTADLEVLMKSWDQKVQNPDASIIRVVDFNSDRKVDLKDLVMLIQYWGSEEASFDIAPSPFGDGVVDVADLEVLMSQWGQ